MTESSQVAVEEDESVMETSSILILQPGSLYLRFGLASDSVPKKVLHAVARKRRKISSSKYKDSYLVQSIPNSSQIEKVEDVRQKVALNLQKSFRSDGKKRTVPPAKKIAELNAAQKPHKVSEAEDEKNWLETKSEFVVGDDVLYLHPDDDYNVHFPFKRGDVNLHQDIGGSQTSVLVDLETIWSHAIEVLLEIPKSQWPNYKVVLIIPALYKRDLIKHYLTLLLQNMGFCAAFVIQDHVAATFGAGQGFACVVDVGDQKTSISCVEDGVSHPETRIQLDYGGSDLTRVFHYLMRGLEFPYKKCDPDTNVFDALLLDSLKMDNCHLDLDICGTAEKPFLVSMPGGTDARKYTVYLSDECLMTPLSLFHTDMFELTRIPGQRRIHFMGTNPGDSEDPHDNIYLSETSRKYTKAGDTSVGEMAGDADASQNMDDELDIVNEDSTSNTLMNSSSLLKRNSFSNTQEAAAASSETLLLPLDQAILKSIESCPNEDLKRKMYSCILLVGGGIKLKEIEKYLHKKLALQVPPIYRLDPMEVIINAKGFSCDVTTWKGAAILSCLETAQEFWIGGPEWSKHGQRLLREKSPFPWT